MRILIMTILSLLLVGCATPGQRYQTNYQHYATACAQIGNAKIAEVNGVTIYNQNGCGIRAPQMVQSNWLGWGSLALKAVLGFKLFDEGFALGVGNGIGALNNSQIGGDGFIGSGPGFNPIDNTAPPFIVEPTIVP